MKRCLATMISGMLVGLGSGVCAQAPAPAGRATRLLKLIGADTSIPLDAVQGAVFLPSFSGTPDKAGALKCFSIQLPPFNRAVYFNGSGKIPWPHDHNECAPWYVEGSFADVRDGGLFAVLELKGGGYLALVPVAGDEYMTWFGAGKEDGLDLLLGTLGTAPFRGDCALMA